jgi:hypothetical protein
MTCVELDEYRCDRCGRVEQSLGRKANGERAGRPKGWGHVDLAPYFPSGGDLCPACYEELCEWFEVKP